MQVKAQRLVMNGYKITLTFAFAYVIETRNVYEHMLHYFDSVLDTIFRHWLNSIIFFYIGLCMLHAQYCWLMFEVRKGEGISSLIRLYTV